MVGSAALFFVDFLLAGFVVVVFVVFVIVVLLDRFIGNDDDSIMLP